jgi:hypothetical protein
MNCGLRIAPEFPVKITPPAYFISAASSLGHPGKWMHAQPGVHPIFGRGVGGDHARLTDGPPTRHILPRRKNLPFFGFRALDRVLF